jgi:hypothetical protein
MKSDFLERQTAEAAKRIDDAKQQRQRDWQRIQTELPDIAELLGAFGKPQYMRIEFADGHTVESGELPKAKSFWDGKLRPCTKPEPSWLQAKRNGNKR